jgi:Tol biopolymer transport system component
VNLTNDAAPDDFPALSADGKKIAWTKGGLGPKGEIWVMEADGSNAYQVTFNAFPDLNATWSTDGSRIAFRSLRDGNCGIYVIDADGRNERRLAPDQLKGGIPGWSPEGNRILFSDTVCARNGAPLSPAPNPGDTAAWSRLSGGVASIEYNLPRAGHVHVRVYDAAGHEVAHPVNEWQSAGRHITMFAFGPAPNQVFRYRVKCGDRVTSGTIETGP